jgi:eukaryotic-like serine/threonine-protein kinase
MSLAVGSRFGPYEILSALGAGGMGEVYRALDTKLNRDIALKILPPEFALDPERLARFKREAQVLASLDHPNIGAIYGLEDSEGVHALVLQLVEGPTLADRIAQGPIPVDEALPMARQIAEALEAAHDKGVIHRDLKPANIKLTADGQVKVLDFGLAKLLDSEASVPGQTRSYSPGLTNSPTMTTPAMTQLGIILGTAAYMSPEQAKGRAADKRCDIWAFGCVLYEMLTGKRAFDGEDVSDTLAAVLKTEPEWTALPRDLPPLIRTLIQRCLEKDRQRRTSDVSIALFSIDEYESIGPSIATPLAVASRATLWRQAVPVLTGVILGSAIVGIGVWKAKPFPPRIIITRFSYTLPDGERFTDQFLPSVAISPDGTQLVYVANQRLYLRSMSDLVARPIPGTEVQTNIGNPVFSSDGNFIAYWTRTGPVNLNPAGVLKRIATRGGVATTIGEVDFPLGLRWNGDSLLFGTVNKGIMRIPATGGSPELLLKVAADEITQGPQILGSGALLFTVAKLSNRSLTMGTPAAWDSAQIVVQSLKSGERKTLIQGGSDARYLPTGHLVYAAAGVLFAAPFDPVRLEVTDGKVPVVEGVLRTMAGAVSSGAAHFSVSDTGSAVYIAGPVATLSDQRDLVLIDRNGSREALALPPGAYENPRISPDGSRVAFDMEDGQQVLIHNLAGNTARRQLTVEGKNRFPIWSPDGQLVAFQSDREGDLAIFWQRADGTAAAERLTRPERGTAHAPRSWSRDGKQLLFAAIKESESTLWILNLPDKRAMRFDDIKSQAPLWATFSPDGRSVAYTSASDVSASAVFVQPFPPTGAKSLISSAGTLPHWSADGKELFYQTSRPWAVTITLQPSVSIGNPMQLPIDLSYSRGGSVADAFDVMPDGKRFIAVVGGGQRASGPPATPQIQFVLNWFEELKQRVPTK